MLLCRESTGQHVIFLGPKRIFQTNLESDQGLHFTADHRCFVALWAAAWLHPEAAALLAATCTAGPSAVGSGWFCYFEITILFLTPLFFWTRFCSINNKTPLNCIETYSFLERLSFPLINAAFLQHSTSESFVCCVFSFSKPKPSLQNAKMLRIWAGRFD